MTPESSRATEIDRTIQQLRAMATEKRSKANHEAGQLESMADQIERREAERIAAENRREIAMGL